MTFNMSEFLKDNLISGYQNGSFTKEQVNIFSMNYLMNGRLTQNDFDEIQEVLEPKEEEREDMFPEEDEPTIIPEYGEEVNIPELGEGEEDEQE